MSAYNYLLDHDRNPIASLEGILLAYRKVGLMGLTVTDQQKAIVEQLAQQEGCVFATVTSPSSRSEYPARFPASETPIHWVKKDEVWVCPFLDLEEDTYEANDRAF